MEDTALSKSLLYYVAPSGDNNFWARIINGCPKEYRTGFGTLAVSLNSNKSHTLIVDPDYFASRIPVMRKLILIHEAGHIALRHLERYLRLIAKFPEEDCRIALSACSNFAMDFADNDSIVRKEKEFDEACKTLKPATDPHEPGKPEFDGLLPERRNLPCGLTFEQYLLHLMQDPHRYFPDQDGSTDCHCGDPSHGEGEGQEVGDSEASAGAQGGPGNSPGQGGSQGTGGGRAQGEGQEHGDLSAMTPSGREANKDASKLDGIYKMAKKHRKFFEKLLKKHHELTGGAHKDINELGMTLTPEQALALGNKLKQEAKKLVISAAQQSKKSRGFIPGGVEAMIEAMLAEEVVPWHWVLEDLIASHIGTKVEEAMSQPNLGLMHLDATEPWPGHTLDPEFHITWMQDTSGSVADAEYGKAIAVMNKLMAQNKNIQLTFMEVDARIQSETETNNIQHTTEKQVKRHGYGGTVFVSGFKRILNADNADDWSCERAKNPHKKPDLLVVATDGYVCIEGECFPKYHPGVPILWLITQNGTVARGMSNAPPDRVIKMFPTPDGD